MQFSFIDLVCALGIVQGFVLALALVKIKKQNASANQILAITLVIASLVLLGRMIIVHDFYTHIFKWISFTDTIIFLFGPLTYLFVRRLVEKSSTNYKLSIYHYLPAAVYVLIFVYIKAQDQTSMQSLYEAGYIYWLFNSFEFIGIVSNVYYLFKCYKLLSLSHNYESNELSFKQTFLTFLSIYLLSITLCVLAWLFCYINAYYLGRYFHFLNYDIIWIAIPIFIYVVGYYSLSQPDIFRLPTIIAERVVAERLNKLEVERLKSKLESLMVDDKVYLQSELTLSEVAEMIQSSPNDVSWVLNNSFACSFYDFINGYRIEEFVKFVERNEHHNVTILALALEAGFNSKSAFNRVFKRHMNCTPSNYIKQVSTHVQVA